MNMLPRLAPRCFYDLVIETAIVRPGPIQGGMVHPYLRRRQKLEDVTYPSEAVRSVLERTMGVSIFQEQVMQLAVVAAGFTPGEADKLRRAMAAWKRKGGIGPFRDKLISGMLARGYTSEYAEQIYRQIQGFGEYGFPESHAASFALLVYVSSWLKCHEPAAFCAALLDSQPLGFYAPAQIVRDAMNHGVEVRPIDVTVSDWHCTLEPSSTIASQPAVPAVRLGLELVAGFNEAAGERIMAARRDAPFTDAEDLARRAQLNRGEISALAKADALATLTGHRRRALWTTLGVDADAPRAAPLASRSRREAPVDLLPPTEGQDIVADYHHTALTLRRHPLALLRERFNAKGYLTAAGIGNARDQQRVRTTGIVTCRQRPSHRQRRDLRHDRGRDRHRERRRLEHHRREVPARAAALDADDRLRPRRARHERGRPDRAPDRVTPGRSLAAARRAHAAEPGLSLIWPSPRVASPRLHSPCCNTMR